MRDMNAGRDINVRGDMVINDHSHECKLLIHCTNGELIAEEQHRQTMLKEERGFKFNKLICALLVAVVLIFAAGVWNWFSGNMNVFSLLTGGAGFVVGLTSFKIYEKPTLFEQRQIDALNEISMLLRERGARR